MVLYKHVTTINFLVNKVTYPKTVFGRSVEVTGHGRAHFGKGVVVGRFSRLEIPYGGVIRIGDNASVGVGVHLRPDGGKAVRIGPYARIQDGCRIYGDVSIGNHVIVAPNVFISSGTHVFRYRPSILIDEQDRLHKETRCVVVEDDCWIGINSVVSPGTKISKGSVVGANSVVTKDVPPYTVVAGCPAKQIGKRLNYKPPAVVSAKKEDDWPYFYSGFDFSAVARDLALHGGMVAERLFMLDVDSPNGSALSITVKAYGSHRVCLSFNGETREITGEFCSISFSLPKIPGPYEFVATDKVVVMACAIESRKK